MNLYHFENGYTAVDTRDDKEFVAVYPTANLSFNADFTVINANFVHVYSTFVVDEKTGQRYSEHEIEQVVASLFDSPYRKVVIRPMN